MWKSTRRLWTHKSLPCDQNLSQLRDFEKQKSFQEKKHNCNNQVLVGWVLSECWKGTGFGYCYQSRCTTWICILSYLGAGRSLHTTMEYHHTDILRFCCNNFDQCCYDCVRSKYVWYGSFWNPWANQTSLSGTNS